MNQQEMLVPSIHLQSTNMKILQQASKTAQVGFLSKEKDSTEQQTISNNLNKSIYCFAENFGKKKSFDLHPISPQLFEFNSQKLMKKSHQVNQFHNAYVDNVEPLGHQAANTWRTGPNVDGTGPQNFAESQAQTAKSSLPWLKKGTKSMKTSATRKSKQFLEQQFKAAQAHSQSHTCKDRRKKTASRFGKGRDTSDIRIESKPINQIIDMKDDTVQYTLSNFNKAQAKIDSVGGFKPGRFDLQQEYDSQFKARVQEVIPVFKPNEFKQGRKEFLKKVTNYEAFRSNAPYYDHIQQKTIVPSVYRTKNLGLRINQQPKDTTYKERRSLSQSVNEQKQSLQESLLKLNSMHHNFVREPIQEATGQLDLGSDQSFPIIQLNRMGEHKEDPYISATVKTEESQEREENLPSLHKANQKLENDVNIMAKNTVKLHKYMVSQELQNIESIQKINKQMSQESNRRTLESNQNDESNDLFHSYSPESRSGLPNNRCLQNIYSMDLEISGSHPDFLHQLSSPDRVGPLHKPESQLILKEREFDNNTTLTSIIESAHKALGNRHETSINSLNITSSDQYSSLAAKDILKKMQVLMIKKKRYARKQNQEKNFINKNIKNLQNVYMNQKLTLQRKNEETSESEELRQFWDQEFDKQLRKASFLTKEQWHTQVTLQNEQTFKRTTDQRKELSKKATVTINEDEDQNLLDNMDDEERAEYEETIREKILEGINAFITQSSISQAIKEFKDELPMHKLAGAKAHIKCGLFVGKLYKKFRMVSERIISSYHWELNRDKVIPKDPGLYRKMLQEELRLDNAQLVDKFVNFLAAEDAKNKRLLREKKIQKEASIPEEVAAQGSGELEPVGDQKTREEGQTRTTSSPISESIRLRSPKYERLPSTSDLMALKLQKKRNDIFINHLYNFQDQLLNEFFDVSETIRDQETMQQEMINPSGDKPLEEIFEKNLEEIMMKSDVYQNVQKLSDHQSTMKVLKTNAEDMTELLKTKAMAQRAKVLKQQQKMKDASTIQMLFGQKREALVLKFIYKLKKAVLARKDANAQYHSEKFISDIMKKNDFNKALKTFARKECSKDHQHHQALPSTVDQALLQAMQALSSSKTNKQIESHKSLDQQMEAVQHALKRKIVDIKTKSSISATLISKDDETRILENLESLSKHISDRNEDVLIEEMNKFVEQNRHEEPTEEPNALQEYLSATSESAGAPLPVLNQITKGYLPLINYQLNESNANSFSQSLQSIVPKVLSKIYLVNNSLKDKELAKLLLDMSKTTGIQQIGIIGNGLGPQSYDSLAKNLLPSQGAQQLRRLVLKDPNPVRVAPKMLTRAIESMQQYCSATRLRQLVLSKLGMDKASVESLGRAVVEMANLEQLDISANALHATHLVAFFDIINDRNNLKSLNIAYNSGHLKKNVETKTRSFEEVFSHFLHTSGTLLHLDISGLGLSLEAILYVANCGLRKSRTLLAVHMSGMNLRADERVLLREALKVKEVSEQTIVDKNLEKRLHFAKVNPQIVKEVFRNEPDKHNEDLLEGTVERAKTKLKSRVKQEKTKPILQDLEEERIVYQRILGHPEIPDSHRWVETLAPQCHICQKHTFTIFVWNKSVAQLQLKKEDARGGVFISMYNQSNLEPIQIHETYALPVLSIDEKIHTLLPLTEFIERLNMAGAATVRNCNNEIEEQRYKDMEEIINNDLSQNNNLNPTYWTHRKAMNKLHKSASISDLNSWYQKIMKMVPADTSCPIDLELYGHQANTSYRNQRTKLQDICNDTFLCAAFLPNKDIDFIVKHKDIPGVNFLRKKQLHNKHMSIQKLGICEKQVRKMKEIRHFNFATSTFKDFVFDDEAILDLAFEKDKELMKIKKFIKDEDDREKTYGVFREHYQQLKNQFLSQVANPKSYPVIDWFDFVASCGAWKVLDKNLTATDVDRIFIATNFEEEDLEENDDNSLCRFEFLEIMARMAKTKFFDKGICGTVWQSCQKFLTESIIPNTIEVMEWQEFRDNLLWTLEVDDLHRDNLAAIQTLYRAFATHSVKAGSKLKTFSKDDALELGKQSMLPLTERQLTVAYSLSKSTIADEMAGFDRYNHMNPTEFFEFLARCAALAYVETTSFAKKIERVLDYVLPLVKASFTPARLDDQIESDSDYDDDIVDEIIQNDLTSRDLN